MNTTTTRVAELIKDMNQYLGVIATVASDQKPEAAVVHFTSDEQLNLYFTTRVSTRKYKNIVQNPEVAFVIYAEHPARTGQFQGVAEIVTDPYEQTRLFSAVVDLINEHNPRPPVDQLSEDPVAFIRIVPTWIRIGDFEVTKKGDVFEVYE